MLDLEYEAYPGMAEQEIARIARAVLADHGCLRAAIAHRTGVVEVGEASVGIAISSAHRAPAFAACKQAIDTLKLTVPIWKKERYARRRGLDRPGLVSRAPVRRNRSFTSGALR